MTLTLRLRAAPPVRIDVASLTLQRLRPLSVDEIRRLPMRIGREGSNVGTLFDVSGTLDDSLCFAGDCSSLDGIGSEWDGGTLVVEGPAGNRLGRRMTAGRISVRGTAGALVASGMRGGRIDIAGDVGEALGGPLRGERTGMRGGRVVVEGSAGPQTAHRMRRGTLVINGQVGSRCGWEMVAGTVVAGTVDPTDLGFAMRRGTILILDSAASTTHEAQTFPVRTPCFSPPTPAPAGFMKLLLDDLAADCKVPARNGMPWQRSLGDLSRGGLGEVLW